MKSKGSRRDLAKKKKKKKKEEKETSKD